MNSGPYQNALEYARKMDAIDPLGEYRSKFFIPQHNGADVRYFCGNSLGLQPRSVGDYVRQELEDWQRYGVEGHFTAKHPWVSYHRMFEEPLAELVGALPSEVVCMNSLTVNLHLMMVSFYRPQGKRVKIICEAGAFPSDQYALETQARFHNLDPEEVVIELAPRAGEHTLRTADIVAEIERHGDELALIMMAGVNYYTGQAFDMQTITECGRRVGALVGFDLAHAAGNLQLHLHDWGVDFAVWCSYKYLNSGPGGVAGAFVHERHGADPELPRFAGWWGNDEAQRFLMKKGFFPSQGAQGWQLSNAPVLSMAAHKASLDIFHEVGIDALAAKRDTLTGYLEFVIEDAIPAFAPGQIEVITPRTLEDRGCQISLLVHENGRDVFNAMTAAGIIVDWREPNVIRAAPAPLYNTFEDAYRFGEVLRSTAG